MQFPERTAQKIDFSVDTTEEYMALAKPPVADGLKDRFVAVQRPVDPTDQEELDAGHHSITELLTVTPADESGREKLLHLQHDHQSDSGWRAVEVELPERRLADGAELNGPIQQIAAFYQGGRIHALIHYTDANGGGRIVLPMLYNVAENRWLPWDLRDDVDDEGYDIYRAGLRNALSSTRQTGVYRTPAGNHVFYGVSTARDDDAFFVVFEDEDGEWQAASETVPSASSTYRIVSSRAEDYETIYSIMRFDDNEAAYVRDVALSYDDGAYDFRLDWQSESENPSYLNLGDVSAAEVTPLPAACKTDNVIVRNNSGGLILVSGYKTGTRPFKRDLTGGPDALTNVDALSVGADRNGQAIVFATNTDDDKLWVLRQTNQGEDGNVIFGRWVCLGNHVAALSAPRAMLDGAEVFLVHTNDRTIQHLVQSPATTIWHTAELAVAHQTGQEPEKISAHAVELIACDEHGAPVPEAALEIYSSHATGIAIDGISHRANPVRPIKVTTDKSGRLGFKMKADSLSSPHLRVLISANRDASETEIQPDSRVCERLAAKDLRFKIDAPSLRKAGLIPAGASDNQAAVIAQMTRRVGETFRKQQKGAGVPRSGDEAHEITVNRNDAGGPGLSKNTKSKWGDTTAQSVVFHGFLGDFLHRLKHAWDDVTKVVVRVANGALKFIIHVGKVMHDFVVDTAHGIATAFEALFKFIADVFGKAVDVVKNILKFVTALFDWEQIAAVNDLLNKSVTGYLDGVEAFIRTKLAPSVGHTVDEIRDKLDETLSQLESAVDGMRIQNGDLQTDSPHHAHMSRASKTATNNMVQGRFALRHSTANKQLILRKTEQYNFPADDDFAIVLDDMGKHLLSSANHNFVETGKEALAKFQNCRTAADFFSGGFSAIIHAFRGILRFTFDLTKEVLITITRLAAILVKWLNSLLQIELPIPVLDHLFQGISGRRLQVLDLFTFGLAIPTAVLSNLIGLQKTRLKRAHVENVEQDLKGAFGNIAAPEVGKTRTLDRATSADVVTPIPNTYEKSLRIASGIMAIVKGVMEILFKTPLIASQHLLDSIPAEDEEAVGEVTKRLQFVIWSAKFLYYSIFVSISIARVVLLNKLAKAKDKSSGIEAFIEEAFFIATLLATVFGLLFAGIAHIIQYPLKLGLYGIYAVKKLGLMLFGRGANEVVRFEELTAAEEQAQLAEWKSTNLDALDGVKRTIAAMFLTYAHFILDTLLIGVLTALAIWIAVVNIQDGATIENWLADVGLTIGSIYMCLSFIPPLWKTAGNELLEDPYTAVPMIGATGALMICDSVCPKVSGGCNIAIGSIELNRIS